MVCANGRRLIGVVGKVGTSLSFNTISNFLLHFLPLLLHFSAKAAAGGKKAKGTLSLNDAHVGRPPNRGKCIAPLWCSQKNTCLQEKAIRFTLKRDNQHCCCEPKPKVQ